ncbi:MULTISPECIES: ADOP family duplicated permease [Rhodanobacter]|uniref:ADOP family duplicated permease n=1 Tax=Rhodanobacter TaxID=75309 RepID=UPI00041B7E32|nr:MULTISPECIES: ADOP family duplicated permease [Rhodanobacter]KZC20685.1 permease [Rhodanobacter denitrificans]UJJ50454.1 ADOP family duplicated permease [Rhodanobacter denitrificans]UJJ57362.1 ADOP family duplicated permease [Rhodanobacter denitrificans]UJM93169.1 ADOP family duplicated permease [Rhodanobacter denitrificans]UJM96701.1 ADOP family duplicated permease [Rhodanobacter denitrificans]
MSVWLAEIWRAWRASLRHPGFLLLASGVLVLGVGCTAAVSTLIDQVLLRSLLVPQASRLLVAGPWDRDHVSAVSPQQYQHMQSLRGVQSIGLIQDGPKLNVAGDGQPELVPALYADRGLLPTIGLPMRLGRGFSVEEDRPYGPHVVILGHGFWQRRYGGDASVIGRSIEVEGTPRTIIGVLPQGFAALGFDGDIMLPTALPVNSVNDGTNYMALLRPNEGVAAATVAAEVNTRLHAMYVAMGNDYWKRAHFGAQQFSAWQRGDARRVLMLFLTSALFVLLIALVNLTNLMLLRALSRSHDAAVRGALGAPMLRLALPALAEGLLVGIFGALAGMLLARVSLGALQSHMPAEWLPDSQLHFGVATWLLALLIGLGGALLAAALGLWRGRRATAIDELREGGRSGLGRHSGRLGRVLVVAQVALATALLSSAGLFLHTLYDAARTPLGFTSGGILTFELAPVLADYPDAAAVDGLSTRVLERLRAIPGVTAVTSTTNLPADLRSGQFNLGGLHVPGNGEEFGTQYHGVGPDFFALFGIAMREGRAFGRNDIRGGETVAIINRAMARQHYGGHALGQTIQRGDGTGMWSARIVGVVGDTNQYGPLEEPPEVLYVPLAQMTDNAMGVFRSFEPMRFALRGHGDPNAWRDALREAVAEVAPNQPIANLRTMQDIVRSTTADMRLNLLLVGIFAALALLLAAAGMYAVMAVAVAAREREFGVRSALGAAPSRLTRLVLRSGLWQITLGLALGVGLALALSGVLRAVLEDIGRSAVDPVALVGVCVLLAIAGLLACLLPALRAGRVHPMRALRGE